MGRLTLIPLCIAIVAAAFGQTPEPVTLYRQFEREAPQAVVEGLESELIAIMAPIGYRFLWRSLESSTGSEVSLELAVVTLKGRCDVAGLAERSNFAGTLGFTHVVNGQIIPFTEIDCDHVLEFMHKGLLAVPEEDRERALGRALGRVLAHELYHIFAKTARHGRSGVSKGIYTVQDLLREGFMFRERESQMLRATAR
jgi:hypothetical protein